MKFFFFNTLKVASKEGLGLESEVCTQGISIKQQFSILKCEKAYRSMCCPSSCQTPCPSCRREHWSLATYRMKTVELDENELLI